MKKQFLYSSPSKTIFLLFIILSLSLGFLFGKLQQKRSVAILENSFDEFPLQQNLQINVDSCFNSSVIPSDVLGNNYSGDITYSNVENVTIQVNDNPMRLEDAIRDGYITINDIIYFARSDATQGICLELFESRHGLSHFTYRYPEYDLRIIYDVYETPDGQQHLINDLVLYSRGNASGPYTDFYDEETGYRLDRENWGITFAVENVTPFGITLKCSQTGGQQIGQLQTSFFHIIGTEGGIKSSTHNNEDYPHIRIRQDENTILELDWRSTHGELPKGNYRMNLAIEDVYDESTVHPLMQNFHDLQYYYIAFTVS